MATKKTPVNIRKKPIPVNEQVSKEDEDKLFEHILSSAQAQEKTKIKKVLLDKKEPIKVIIKKEIKKKPIMEIVKTVESKPLQEETKEKIIEKIEEIKKEELIEYSIKEVTKYDLNWYFMKEKYFAAWYWFWSPYTKYVKWFNESFNKDYYPQRELPKEEWQTSDNLEDLYEQLPVLKEKYPIEKQELQELMKIRKALQKMEYEEDLSHNIIRSEK